MGRVFFGNGEIPRATFVWTLIHVMTFKDHIVVDNFVVVKPSKGHFVTHLFV